MEDLMEYCKATKREIESSVFFRFARTEVLKFNRSIDVACAHARYLDQLVQRYFSETCAPKDRNNSMAPYAGSKDETSRRRMDRDTKDYRETKNLEGNQTECNAGEIGQPPAVPLLPDEDSADHYVPRRLFLFNIENLKSQETGGRPLLDRSTEISVNTQKAERCDTSATLDTSVPETSKVTNKTTDNRPRGLKHRIKKILGLK